MVDDRNLVQRIAKAYRASVVTEMGPPGLFWFNEFVDMKRPIHDALMADDISKLQEMLRHPDKTNLFYGFDNLNLNFVLRRQPSDAAGMRSLNHRLLVNLCVALGSLPRFNPEQPRPESPVSIEQIFEWLDPNCGFRVEFPILSENDLGLGTSRGLVTERAVQAVYQTCRISLFCHDIEAPRILEIGAGLGRTAYYSWQRGLRDYTIVDIPMTGVAQAYFLGRFLGEDCIKLYGETDGGGIRILPPQAFFDLQDHYDVAVNVDSVTEMAREVAQKYLTNIENRAGLFLSVNHEFNPFTVRNLLSDAAARLTQRNLYWMREGYVEEIVDFERPRRLQEIIKMKKVSPGAQQSRFAHWQSEYRRSRDRRRSGLPRAGDGLKGQRAQQEASVLGSGGDSRLALAPRGRVIETSALKGTASSFRDGVVRNVLGFGPFWAISQDCSISQKRK